MNNNNNSQNNNSSKKEKKGSRNKSNWWKRKHSHSHRQLYTTEPFPIQFIHIIIFVRIQQKKWCNNMIFFCSTFFFASIYVVLLSIFLCVSIAIISFDAADISVELCVWPFIQKSEIIIISFIMIKFSFINVLNNTYYTKHNILLIRFITMSFSIIIIL